MQSLASASSTFRGAALSTRQAASSTGETRSINRLVRPPPPSPAWSVDSGRARGSSGGPSRWSFDVASFIFVALPASAQLAGFGRGGGSHHRVIHSVGAPAGPGCMPGALSEFSTAAGWPGRPLGRHLGLRPPFCAPGRGRAALPPLRRLPRASLCKREHLYQLWCASASAESAMEGPRRAQGGTWRSWRPRSRPGRRRGTSATNAFGTRSRGRRRGPGSRCSGRTSTFTPRWSATRAGVAGMRGCAPVPANLPAPPVAGHRRCGGHDAGVRVDARDEGRERGDGGRRQGECPKCGRAMLAPRRGYSHSDALTRRFAMGDALATAFTVSERRPVGQSGSTPCGIARERPARRRARRR